MENIEYDADGNEQTDAGAKYVYDFENKLISVRPGSVQVVYDGDGTRVAETAGDATTTFLVDDDSPTGYSQVVEERRAGLVVQRYLLGRSLISVGGPSRPTAFYGHDASRNIRQLFDASGNVTDSYNYDAFGNVLLRTGTTRNRYTFASEDNDDDIGLVYLRAPRYLNTKTGRFVSRDTWEGEITHPQSQNGYVYVTDDPVNQTDPSGYGADGGCPDAGAELLDIVDGGTNPQLGLVGGQLRHQLCPHVKKKFFHWMEKPLLDLATELSTNRDFLFAHSGYEAGWGDEKGLDHNIALNNPWGVNNIRKRKAVGNRHFASLEDAMEYYKKVYGKGVQGAKNIDDYINGLPQNYNTVNPHYWDTLKDVYGHVLRYKTACSVVDPPTLGTGAPPGQ